MAISPVVLAMENSNPYYHARSTSMPARPHPLPQSVEEELSKLKAWAAPLLLQQPASAEATAAGLAAIATLYDSVDKLLALPRGQQAVRRHFRGGENWVVGMLDASVRLLDACSVARDSLVLIRERAKDVQSALRRRCAGPAAAAAVDAYVRARANAKKDASRCLRSLSRQILTDDHGGVHGRACSPGRLDKDANASTMVVIWVLQEARAICISFLRSLLSSTMCSPLPSGKSSTRRRSKYWSLVSRAMLIRGKQQQQQGGMDELERVDDLVLGSLQRSKNVEACTVQITLQKHLMGTLDTQLGCLEDALDCMFRRLIQNRVSLLNILSS